MKHLKQEIKRVSQLIQELEDLAWDNEEECARLYQYLSHDLIRLEGQRIVYIDVVSKYFGAK